MLDNSDIEKLQGVFVTKQDLENLEEKMMKGFSDVMTTVDGYAKRADTYFQEMVMLSHKVDRNEKWIKILAQKLDLKLEY